MRVFVAGATGAIGRRLVPQLVARGHEVTGTTTRPGGIEPLRAAGADPVVVDGLDGAAVREAVARAGPDAIVHEMTALAGQPDLKHFDRWFAVTNRLRTIGTRNLLSAAELAGVSRFVAQSYTGWTNPRTGPPVKTENDPLDTEPAKAQTHSLAAIRFLESAVLEAPLEGIALRYGALYGPGATEPLAELVRKRRLPIVGGGRGIWSWIHVDDAAAATVAALEHGERGVYNIVDDEPAAVSEWLPYLASALGAPPPRHVAGRLARPFVGQVGVRWMTEARGASNERARRELSWRLFYPSWRVGFEHGLGESRLDRDDIAALIGPPPGFASDAGIRPRGHSASR
jgi:nucleoside-diphosphate-sugar epimerase